VGLTLAWSAVGQKLTSFFVDGPERGGGPFGWQRAWLGRDNLLLGGVKMAAEVPGNVSAFGSKQRECWWQRRCLATIVPLGATEVLVATVVP